MRMADALGVTSFLEVSEDKNDMQLARQAADSFAASPSDLESGDFEIKCKTTCGFAKSGAADQSGNGGGEAALEAAKDLAAVQDQLKAVQTELMNSPGNAGLQAKEIHLQALVQDKVQALQAAAGLPKAAANMESTAVALAAAKKKLEMLQGKYDTDPTPALEAAIDLQQADIARLEALLKNQKNPNNDLEAKIGKLQERVKNLKTALAATPDDKALKDEIAAVEEELAKQQDNSSFNPKQQCTRVCMEHQTEEGAEAGADSSCLRMCVNVMRHLVYNLASSF